MINTDKYVLYIGKSIDILDIKTATGFFYWRKDDCLGEVALPGCTVSTGLPTMNLMEAWEKGARKLIFGIALPGGVFQPHDIPILTEALSIGYTIVSGAHSKLADIPDIRNHQAFRADKILELRNAGAQVVGNGEKRAGKRLLTVGTDCCVGKMFTALSIHAALQKRGISSTFRATGQTGLMIAESGICADAIISDFLVGNIEQLSPENNFDHWDIIEGQASLFTPVGAEVSVALLQGSQPDALVVCHEWGRKIMDGTKSYIIPQLHTVIDLNLTFARMTNPKAKVIGVSMNTRLAAHSDVERICKETEDILGVPCVDVVRHGADKILPCV